MKAFILYFSLLFCSGYICAQSWQWKQASPGTSILKDLNNDVYVLSESSSGFSIRKIDADGNLIWSKTASGDAGISAFKTDPANNLVVVGNLSSSTAIGAITITPVGTTSFYILKISSIGMILSTGVYGSPAEVTINDLFITPSGDYLLAGGFEDTLEINGHLLAGQTESSGFLIKTDPAQNVIWSEKTDATTGLGWFDEAIETSTGKIYATLTFQGFLTYHGYDFSSSGQYLMQLDGSRDIVWEHYLGYPGLTFNHVSDIQAEGDTVYMKEYVSHHGIHNTIYRWSNNGLQTEINFYEASRLAYEVANGQIYYAFTGYNESDYFRKIGTLSTALSYAGQFYDSALTTWSHYEELQYIDPSSLYISGMGEGFPGNFLGLFNFSLSTSTAENISMKEALRVTPNPAQGIVNISFASTGNQETLLCVYDILGNCILKQALRTNTEKIDLTGKAKGIYFLELDTGKARLNKKIVLN